jgi:hypothetical protein
MTLQDLRKESLRLIKENPQLANDIWDFYSLAVSEIEDGGSESHECDMAYNDIIELINNPEEL